jgi:imidazoleglycerol phosphate dehydratase HisB
MSSLSQEVTNSLFVTCASRISLALEVRKLFNLPSVLRFIVKDLDIGNSEKVATGLGFICHLLDIISSYMHIPLRYQMITMSSRSSIVDHSCPPSEGNV